MLTPNELLLHKCVDHAIESYNQNISSSEYSDQLIKILDENKHTQLFYMRALDSAYVFNAMIAARANPGSQTTKFKELISESINSILGPSPVPKSSWHNFVESYTFWRLSCAIIVFGVAAVILSSCGLCIPVVGAALIGAGISLIVMLLVGTMMIGAALGCFSSRALTLSYWDQDNSKSEAALNYVLRDASAESPRSLGL